MFQLTPSDDVATNEFAKLVATKMPLAKMICVQDVLLGDALTVQVTPSGEVAKSFDAFDMATNVELP